MRVSEGDSGGGGGGGGCEWRGGKVFADVKSEAYELSKTVKVEDGSRDIGIGLKEDLVSVAEVSWLEQFPKRWLIVILCFSAFLLCNMDRVSVKLCFYSLEMEHCQHSI